MTHQQELKMLMKENIQHLVRASDQLSVSLGRCREIDLLEGSLTIDEQEKLEALTGRFARLSDLIT